MDGNCMILLVVLLAVASCCAGHGEDNPRMGRQIAGLNPGTSSNSMPARTYNRVAVTARRYPTDSIPSNLPGSISNNFQDIYDKDRSVSPTPPREPVHHTYAVFVDAKLVPSEHGKDTMIDGFGDRGNGIVTHSQDPAPNNDKHTPHGDDGSHEHGDHDDGVHNHDSHYHDSHDHVHLDKVDIPGGIDDIGLNIEPLDLAMMHSGSNDEALHELPLHTRTDKSTSVEDVNLCTFCLCNEGLKRVSCQSGNMIKKYDTKVLELDSSVIPVTAVSLELTGFDSLTIRPDTFANETSRLRRIVFEDIGALHLQKHSLHFSPRARVNMEVAISLLGCKVPVIPSLALTQLTTDRHSKEEHNLDLEQTRFITIEFYRCAIGNMETHAMYQARLLFFNMTRVTIDSMSQETVDLDVYEEWIIQDSSLPHLPRKAVCIYADKSVVFSRNIITELDSYAFAIEAGQVLFEYNTVKKIRANAFLNITPLKSARSANIVFLNNTVLSAEPDSLVTSEEYPRHERKVLDNRFKVLCECNISVYFKEMLDIKENDTYDVLMYEAVVLNSMCLPYSGSPRYSYIGQFLEKECSTVPTVLIVIAAVVVAILLASIIVAVVCAKRANKARDEANYLGECSSRSFSTLNTHAGPRSPTVQDFSNNVYYDSEGNPSWIMAVPEMKTYQETEVHVTYEESHPIQASARSSYQDQMMLEVQRKNLTRQSCPFN